MRRSRRFLSNGWDGLEPRVVLSAGPRLARAQVSILNDIPIATGPQARLSFKLISEVFDQFQTTYFATLNEYLTPPNNSMAGQAAFKIATVQEVNLLSQNVIRTLLPVNGATDRQLHGQPPIQTLLNNRILATTPFSLNGGLATATPPVGTTVANDQLYVTAAGSAIAAAETAVQNGVRVLRLGAFNGSHH